MDVLVLGWSDIVRRRVMPALAGLAEVHRIHLASASAEGTAEGLTGRTFTGPSAIDDALDAVPEAVVYVSGVNTAHADRVGRALESGHHVIVDKPAFLGLDEARRCLDLARGAGLMLAEATVWAWHTQVQGLLERMALNNLVADSLQATFVIPRLPQSNFRADPRLGGGVVADMGAYAMSPGRVFGGGEPVSVDASVTRRSPDGLDVAVSVEAEYSSGLRMSGAFSMDGSYANRLDVVGSDWHASLRPAFSSKPDAVLRVELLLSGDDLSFDAGPSDPFTAFLRSALVDGVRTPGTWTDTTADSASDLLRLAGAAGLGWGEPGGLHYRRAGSEESQ